MSRRTSAGGPLGDHRGLTAAGAVVLLLALGTLGAAIDHLLGHHLWVLFGICFLSGVVLTSARVHIEDLAASIVIVPLSYALVGSIITGVTQAGSPLREVVASAGSTLVLSAPVLLIAVALAAVIALGRGRAMNRARRRARARAIRRQGGYTAAGRPGAAPPAAPLQRR